MIEVAAAALALPVVVWATLRALGAAASVGVVRDVLPYLLTALATLVSYLVCFRVAMPYLLHPYRPYAFLLKAQHAAWTAPPVAVQALIGTALLFMWLHFFYRLGVGMIARGHCGERRVNARLVEVYSLKITLLSMLVFAVCVVADLKDLVALNRKVPFAAELTIGVAIALVHVPLMCVYYGFRVRQHACM